MRFVNIFVATLFLFVCITTPASATLITSDDPGITFWNLGNGVITYKYQKSTSVDVLNWRQNVISSI